MSSIYFEFKDGTIKERKVMSKIHGLKLNGERPIAAKVYVTNDTFFNDENFPKWLSYIHTIMSPHVEASKAVSLHRVED